MNLVPMTAIIVIGVVAISSVWLSDDVEVAKIAISSIGSMVTGGVTGYVLGKRKREKLDKTPS